MQAARERRAADTGYVDFSSTDEVVIRPRPGGAPDRRRLRFMLAFLPLVGLGIARQFAAGLSLGLWFLAGFLTLALLAVLARADFFAQTGIRVGDTYVRRTGYFGRSARCPRAAIARVVEAELMASRIAGFPDKWLLFLDAENKTLMRAYAAYYPVNELFRLRDALDVPWESRVAIGTFSEMRREIPRSFPWPLAHIWLTLTVIALIGFIIAGAFAGSS